EGYHVVPPPYTGTFMPPKPNLVFHDALTVDETVLTAFNNKVHHQRLAKHGVNKAHSHKRRPINLRPSPPASNFHPKVTTAKAPQGNPHHALKDKGVINSGCSRHMTGNMSYLSDFEEINGGYVAFGGNPKGGKITGKGKIRTCKLDFDDVYFVKELTFNLFSISQMVHRENNMYNVDLKNIVPSGDLTCLFAKATLDEFNLWHRRLGHIKFKTMNKLVKGIKREFSVARTPQQNGIAKRKNMTLIDAARTMLADSLLPIPFWAEAVNTTCYVQNRVLVTKPYNKTPYELSFGRPPSIGFMRPFGCPVTILNTIDPLGKFNGKADEEFLVGYSVSRSGPTWLFDIDTLTK
nr:ribonuclease H-like domain-containing protein [Tanacetum cinerariifolium]